MKSYQFFKTYKRFHMEGKKTLIQQSMRKEKLGKVGICFKTGCFIKPFEIIINHFKGLWYPDDARNIKRGSWVQQIARNGKLQHFKNNFDSLVLNIKQVNFLYWQSLHIWRLIKNNNKRSSLFIVLPTLISWSETKILQIATTKDKLKMPKSLYNLYIFLALNVSTV